MKKQHDLRFLFIIVTKHFILITMNDLTVFWADSSVIKTSVTLKNKNKKNNLYLKIGLEGKKLMYNVTEQKPYI